MFYGAGAKLGLGQHHASFCLTMSLFSDRVTQVPVLGPLLFPICINEIVSL